MELFCFMSLGTAVACPVILYFGEFERGDAVAHSIAAVSLLTLAFVFLGLVKSKVLAPASEFWNVNWNAASGSIAFLVIGWLLSAGGCWALMAGTWVGAAPLLVGLITTFFGLYVVGKQGRLFHRTPVGHEQGDSHHGVVRGRSKRGARISRVVVVVAILAADLAFVLVALPRLGVSVDELASIPVVAVVDLALAVVLVPPVWRRLGSHDRYVEKVSSLRRFQWRLFDWLFVVSVAVLVGANLLVKWLLLRTSWVYALVEYALVAVLLVLAYECLRRMLWARWLSESYTRVLRCSRCHKASDGRVLRCDGCGAMFMSILE